MLKNFIWQRENQPHNALSYVFLYMSMVYGIAFTFIPSSTVVQNSAWAASALTPEVWGIACLALFVTTMFTIATRHRTLGIAVGFWGFLLWGYGFGLYLAFGLYFSAFVIYLGQMCFWAFWYLGVKRFYAREDKLETLLRDERNAQQE